MASQLPILERQVKLDNTVGQAPFSQSFDRAALTPTALGEFGMNLATTASSMRAQQNGFEAGKTPHGTLLPPITNADKVYQDAYIAQSQSTLGLQASKLMQEGQTELNKAWKLTPDMIASYTQNMTEGLSEIINNAPMQAQPGLAAQFQSSLQNSTSNLNNKMIGQQKQDALQKASLANNDTLSAIFEAAKVGNLADAEKMQNDMNMRNDSMANIGMITPLQSEASKKSARMSLYTGVYSGEAIKAFNNKEGDQFLADFLNMKPKGMPSSEWEGIAKNVLAQVQLQESFQQRNETSLYSEANRKLNEGTLTQDFIAQLESETTSKPRFNNFMAQVAVQQRKNHTDNTKVNALIPQWTNVDSMAVADNKTKNLALIQAAQDVQKRASDGGRSIDEFQAQTEAMSTAGTPVQSYTEQLNAGLLSGNPELMLRNLNAYRELNNSNPRVLTGVSSQARAMMTKFESQMEDGNAPDLAALNASEIVLKKDEKQDSINAQLYSAWENKYANTPSRINSWASQFADIGEGASINNLPAFAIHAKQIFKDNMALLNGDIEAATKMTREGLQRAWGTTEVNGKKEFVFQPVERTIGLDEAANPLIKSDLYEQLQAQIAPMNAAYEEGKLKKDNRMSFKYELEERPTWEQFRSAQALIAKKRREPNAISAYSGTPLSPSSTGMQEDKELEDAISTINKFKDNTIKIKRIFDGGHSEEFEIAIAANPGLQQDPSSGIIGSYNVSMRSNNGPSAPMNGWFRGPLSSPEYRPNQSQIRQRYFDLVGLNSMGKSAQQVYQEYLSIRKSREESGVKDSISQFGRGFR